jgi:hypothetical protein
VQTFLDAGQNPPEGAMVFYYLKEKPQGELRLSILDGEGQVIKSFSSQEPPKEGRAGDGATPAGEEIQIPLAEGEEQPGLEVEAISEEVAKDLRAPAEAGLNRFVWNMRYPDARQIPDENTLERFVVPGPLAPPGRYQVRLTVDGQDYTESFELVKDPRVPATQQDFDAQFQLLRGIRDTLTEVHDAVSQLRDVRRQVEDWQRRAKGQANADGISNAANTLLPKLKEIEDELIQVKAASALSYPARLKEKLATLTMIVASGDHAPTRQTQEVFASLRERVDAQIGRLHGVMESELGAFNNAVRESNLPVVAPAPIGEK